MSRSVLSENNLHPAIAKRVGGECQQTIDEIIQAVDQHPVVVVGMAWNPFVKKACALLEQAGIDFQYLEYGNYLKQWRLRTAIKMYTGWQTFPQVFVGGQLVGGFDDLKALSDSGELKALLAQTSH